MIYNGTKKSESLTVTNRVTDAFGRRGDDHFSFQSRHDCVVDGGFGYDVFEYQLSDEFEVKYFEISDEKTIIKVFDADTGEQMQKIVLHDIEQIDAFQIG